MMTDTPIKDALYKYTHNNYMLEYEYSDVCEAFDNGARASLAQIKPFLDAYNKYGGADEGSAEEEDGYIEMFDTYQSCVVPLLKELGE